MHGDPRTRNVVQRPDGSLTLIDWEMGGRGLAVLDLAHCLMESHLDATWPDDEPAAWLISPDEARISAVASGYASIRRLTAPERQLLPAAARFPAAIIGAVHLEAALIGGATGPSMDAPPGPPGEQDGSRGRGRRYGAALSVGQASWVPSSPVPIAALIRAIDRSRSVFVEFTELGHRVVEDVVGRLLSYERDWSIKTPGEQEKPARLLAALLYGLAARAGALPDR